MIEQDTKLSEVLEHNYITCDYTTTIDFSKEEILEALKDKGIKIEEVKDFYVKWGNLYITITENGKGIELLKGEPGENDYKWPEVISFN